MKKGILLTIVLILIGCISRGENFQLDFLAMNRDSLMAIIHQKKIADTTRLNALYAYARSYDYVNPDSLIFYTMSYRKEADRIDNKGGMARSYQLEGFYYTMLNKHKEALSCYIKELKYGEESGNLDFIGDASASMGLTYTNMNMPDKAIIYLQKCLEVAKKFKDPRRRINVMGNLSYTYFRAGNLAKAIEITKSLIFEINGISENMDLIRLKAGALCNLAQMQMAMGETRGALKNLLESYDLNKRLGNLNYLGICMDGLGILFAEDTLNLLGSVIGDKRPSIQIGISYLQESENKARLERDTMKLVISWLHLSKAYIRLKNFRYALDYLLEGWRYRGTIADLQILKDYSNAFSKVYSNLGDYQKAYNFASLQLQYSDSLEKVKIAEKVSLLTESFEIEQMEGQLDLKEKQLTNNRYITWLFIAISALVLILALIVFYFLRQKQKAGKLLEQQNREIEKARNRAEQSEKFKERFLASMSHEIRTPLNAVIGMTGLLLDEQQPPKTKQYLDIIKEAGEHLTGIINDILDLSKIEAGKLELHQAPFSLQNLLEEMKNLFAVRAKEKDLQLVIHAADCVPAWVSGDSGRIRQVLLNLVGNAIKFTDHGSVQIKITPGGADKDKQWFTFSVEDTGSGIPEAEQAAIFEEFVQVGQGGDQKVAGTGLGLSISKKLVERMGGTLKVESEPGKGSIFSFTISMGLSSESEYRAIQREKDKSMAAIKGNFRILVVDDNLSNQVVTEGLLERILPESIVSLAENGYKAIELLEKDRFDLVLMDVRMSGMDGYETTRKLRGLPNENAKIPVVALTASVIRADIQFCLEAGMDGYVPKPVSRELLARTIREQLKISDPDAFITATGPGTGFLDELPDLPSWATGLADICNGKKARFINYLQLFNMETDKELVKWNDLMEKEQHNLLALSIHKIIPHLKIFTDEYSYSLAGTLEESLRFRWEPSFRENIQMLREKILAAQKEALSIINDML